MLLAFRHGDAWRAGAVMHPWRLATMVVAVLWATVAMANIEVNIKNYTTDDGLPSNYVINMVQDPQGYLWVATHNGLSRFDGYTFQNFNHDNAGHNRLPHSNIIRHIDQNPNGLLWVRFYGDVYSCFDTNRNRFVSYTDDGTDPRGLRECTILPSGDTWLWMKGSGALRVVYADGTPRSTHFSRQAGNLGSNRINFIAEDAGHHVWLGTDEGLMHVEGDHTRTLLSGRSVKDGALVDSTLYLIDNGGNIYCSDNHGQVRPLLSDSRLQGTCQLVPMQHRLLILTSADTWELDPRQPALERSSTLQAPNGYLGTQDRKSVVDLSGQMHFLSDDGQVQHLQIFPHAIQRETYGQAKASEVGPYLWITTQGNGLFVHDKNTGETRHLHSSANMATPLNSDNIFNQMVDRVGNLWIAYDNMGIARLSVVGGGVVRSNASIESAPGRSNEMLTVRRQPGGQLLATNHQHDVFSVQADGTIDPKPIAHVPEDHVRAVLQQRDGTLWLGTDYHGLRIGNRWYSHSRTDSASLGHNHVLNLLEDSSGRVWVACASGGLDLAEPSATGYRFRHFFGPQTLHRKIISLYECSDHSLIAGTDRGIIVFNPTELLADSTRYTAIFEDNEDNWFDCHAIVELPNHHIIYATTGAGLYISEQPLARLRSFRRYTTADGLPDLTCASLVLDREGMLWVGTQWGLARLNLATGVFNRYHLAPDHLGNVFANGGACLLDNGHLLFATNNGLLAFDPALVSQTRPVAPQPFVSNIYINDLPLGDVTDADATEPLRLSHDQNTLTFCVSCFDYGDEQLTEYSFRLKGADHAWSHPTRQNSVTYSNLSPGSYTLLVRSRNTELSSEFAESQFTFSIKPPLWATWWARLGYLLVVLLIGWQIAHSLRTQYRLRRTLELERRMTQFKSEFFMNISHELRTPLMLIQGSAERLRSLNQVSGEAKQPIKNMTASVSRLLRLTSQLLTFNKLQSDKLHLRLQTTDVIRMARDIVLTFNDTASTRRIAMNFIPAVASLEMPLDRDMFDKMLYNLLSNALKYTPDGGKVDVSMQVGDREDGHDVATGVENVVSIAVADTGIGIKPEQREQLFKRFARSTVAVDSIGIGLNLAYHLARLHHGSLTHSDNPQGGSIFTILLPLGDDSYQADDWATSVVETAPADDAATQPEDYLEMPPVPLNERRVVLAEDDDDVRQYLTRELGRYFTIVPCPDGQAALDEIKRQKPDLVVSDVVMPHLNGIELLRRLRQDDDLFDIPFILLTAMDDAQRHMQGIRSGADSYLPKPVSINLLTTRCIKLLEQYERLKQAFSRETLSPQQAPIIATDQDKRFREVLDAKIEARLSDPRLNIDELGESMNYRHSQFFTRVKEVTGMPPGEYIKRIKMERAVELLRDETLTISEVAYRLGFNDPLYFGRCFKQHYSVTPSQFRKGKTQASK